MDSQQASTPAHAQLGLPQQSQQFSAMGQRVEEEEEQQQQQEQDLRFRVRL